MDTVDRIFELVDQKFKEQQSFAGELGISADTVSDWRRRKSGSYAKRIEKIASVLDTTVEYLLTGASAPVPSGLSEEDAEILRQIHDRPGLRILLSRTSKASDEDINMVVDVVEAVLKKLEGQP